MGRNRAKSKRESVKEPEPKPEEEPVAPRRVRRRIPPSAWYALAIVVFAVILFAPVLKPDAVLMTTDDSIGPLSLRKQYLPEAFRGAWNDSSLLGRPVRTSLNWTSTLLWVLPLRFYANWNHAITLAIASFFLGLYLRRRGVSWMACSLGGLTAFWLGSNFTLTYAGHLAKFSILMWAAVFVYLLEFALETRKKAWACLAGGAFGAMFLEQPDVGLFFALGLGPYTLFACWREYGKTWSRSLGVCVPLFATAFLVACHPLWSGYKQVAGQDITTTSEDPVEKWNFLTQWSWPPEETIDFFAPGFMGWRSGEPEGPYWGRMGRSPDWETTQQGFPNFKLENQYLGAIPLLFAFWVLFAALRMRSKEASARRDVLFWSALCLVTFLLACGKYIAPLYRTFAMLPMVSSVRNPNKFLQVYQFAVAILAAYGMDAMLGLRRDEWRSALSRTFHISFLSIVAVLTGFLGLWWTGSAKSVQELTERMGARGFGDGAVIAENLIHSLGHATLMFGIVLVVLYLFTLQKRALPANVALACGWLLLVIVSVDAVLLSRNYVRTMDLEPIRNNRVAQLLKERLGHQRASLTSQGSFYNNWLTYLFPYHEISTINITAAPRMGGDYRTYLNTLGRDPIRLWQLSAVGYILGPGQVWSELSRNPVTRAKFDLHYAYNIAPAGPGSVRVIDATEEQPGRHCVIRFKDPAPRFVMVDQWEILPGDETLEILADPAFEPYSKVFLDPETNPPEPPPEREDGGIVGQVQVQKLSAGLAVLKVSTEREAILRFCDKYERDWTAKVDGKPVPVHRCDYIVQGVHITPGLHRVVFRYKATNPTFWIQLVAFGVCGTAGASLWIDRRRRKRAGEAPDASDGAGGAEA